MLKIIIYYLIWFFTIFISNLLSVLKLSNYQLIMIITVYPFLMILIYLIIEGKVNLRSRKKKLSKWDY